MLGAGEQRLHQVSPESLEVEQVWNDLWEQQLLQRAVADVRAATRENRTFRAFELYVILDHPAQEVAAELGLHIDSVYRAKQHSRQLRTRPVERILGRMMISSLAMMVR